MFEYQRFSQFFAPVAEHLEELCAQELETLGAKDARPLYRGVRFTADIAALYRINYRSRLATRIHAPLKTFPCHSTKYLTKSAANIAWEEILSLEKTFAITASVSNSAITHSLYAALCLKDGIADYFTAKYGKRPNVDTDNPDVRINLHIERNKAVVSLDTSGESLHKRGYRQSAIEAPMQETLAAALMHTSSWDGERPLWDCMCGSGTILCEALMHYCRVPAQFLRKSFGFFNMPDFDNDIWEQVRSESLEQMRPLPKGLIRGSDASAKAVEISARNLRSLPYHESVELRCTRFQDVPAFEKGTIITNPPYGKRLGSPEEVKVLYRELGDFLKRNCQGTTAFILSGAPELRKSLGLKTSKRLPFNNGSIACELLVVESYGGAIPQHN